MATERYVKPMVSSGCDDDDDEEPLVFKRTITKTSNQNQSNCTSQKSKMVPNPSTKASSMKSPLGSPQLSASSAKPASLKSPTASTSSGERSKQLSRIGASASIKEQNLSLKDPFEFNSDGEADSEDDTPSNYKLLGSSNQIYKGPELSGQLISKPPLKKTASRAPMDRDNKTIKTGESSDKAANASRLPLKEGTSGSKSNVYGEKKPLASSGQQNGSTMRNERRNPQASGKTPLEKPNSVLAKRPSEKGNFSDQSSAKKLKLLDSSTPVKYKQVSVKADKSDDKRKIQSLSKVNQGSTKARKLDDDDHVPMAKRVKTESSDIMSSSAKQENKKVVSNKAMKESKYSTSSKALPSGDGHKKWTTLVHNGVIFPPPYKPHRIKIFYKGKPVNLTPEQEEVATMFAVMRDTDYYNKPTFRENFWNDWRKLLGKNHVIQNLNDCNFDPINEWHLKEKEKKKQMNTEEKKALKEEKLKQEEKYMWAIVDGVKEKVGNFRVEPPGLFRGRGEHPKMGKLKKRIHPSDITINIGKDAPVPECPIPGERWKEVKHDNTVTWLAFWNDPINPKEFKYVFLAASSSLKGQSDKEKYEKARKLKGHIDSIRAAYTKDFTSKDVTKRQIAVATYLIDKLALRAGNEKDDDEADTVGCCTLKVGNVECIPPNKLKFDFLGKDSIQYVNTVEVEPPVYKAIGQFQSGKAKSDDLFDELDTTKLNAHLKELMPGLTAKVFRTYNASITLDSMLSREAEDGDVGEKVVIYQHANKQVAIICNHQRTVSKSHGAQIEKLSGKVDELKDVLKELKTDLDRAKKGKPPLTGSDGKRKRNLSPEAIEKKISQTNMKIEKMERDMKTKEDLKTVALGTSKINYMDPRITVAWCKRQEVPIEKIFTKSLLAKFAWAMDVDPDFRF